MALSVQQLPHYAKANFQCFPHLVIVQDAECIDDSVNQQFLARRTLSAILVGNIASNQENAPHTSGSKTNLQRLHQVHFF